MSATSTAWGIVLLLVLSSTLVVAAGTATTPSRLTSAAQDPGTAALAAASASLSEGRGPATEASLSCNAIGSLSMGCVTAGAGEAAPAGSIGWQRLCAEDSCPPPARGGAGMAYDPIRGYVVLFGGITNLTTAPNTTFSDTWVFQDGNWSQLDIPGPSARLGEYMAYDVRDHYIVMFGGGPYLTLNSSLYFDDTWTFQNGTWTELNLAVHPNARGLGGFTWDATDDYLLMYGGMTSQTDVHSDTWTFWGGQWHNLSLVYHPPPLLSPALAYDPALQAVLLFGGATPSPTLEFGDDLEQTWSYAGGAWTNLTGSIHGATPAGRVLSAMAYDPAQGYMILYGGWNTTSGAIFGDTWIFLGGYWTELFLSPSPANAIIGANLISTVSSSGLLLFGGIAGSYTDYASTNATWVFGPPPPDTTTPLGGPVAAPYSVTIVSAPTTCAPPSVKGQVAASPTSYSLVAGAYNATAPACSGYMFDGWFSSGGVTPVVPSSGTTPVDVVGNGTLTAYYTPAPVVKDQANLLPLAGVVGGLVALGLAAVWVFRRGPGRQLGKV